MIYFVTCGVHARRSEAARNRTMFASCGTTGYSTVTLLARLRGLSTSSPRPLAKR
jgi:hypothetical protein